MYENVRVSRHLEEELAWVIDKLLRTISNKMLFKTVVSNIDEFGELTAIH